MNTYFEFSLERPVLGSELIGCNGHLSRSNWLAKHIREDDIYFMQDGVLSQIMFKEVLSTFLGGNYLATITLGFSLIERSIAGRLAFIDAKTKACCKSEKLLDEALARGWLTGLEHTSLNDLRILRNPIMHFRDHRSEGRPEVRAALNARTTEQELEAGAKRVLEAAIRVLKKAAL